ncbi:hypothetical protein RSW84_28015, partial [Escherichia coli]|uniref:hypothetical protein n=1 Tax=Escherichia coli TaxID=562 RepID=UPI0028E083EA
TSSAICEGDPIQTLEGESVDGYEVFGWFSINKTENQYKIADGSQYTPEDPELGDNVYYLAFYDEENSCWGPTQEVTFTVNPN